MPTFSTLSWLFAIGVTIHNAEEAWLLPDWSQTAGRWHHPVRAPVFRFAGRPGFHDFPAIPFSMLRQSRKFFRNHLVFLREASRRLHDKTMSGRAVRRSRLDRETPILYAMKGGVLS